MSGDTIAAIATPPGEGGIAVVRISGPAAIDVAESCFAGPRKLRQTPGHTACVGSLIDDKKSPVDEVVCTVYRGPNSYTGEDVVEVSCHGGAFVTRRVLETLLGAGARMAEPGEFTKRAFLNGRIDLAQAEAVADLIRASSDAAHRSSVAQLEGALSGKVKSLRDGLAEVLGMLELELDFAEEGLEVADRTKVLDLLGSSREALENLLATYRYGRIYREGVKVVLAGAPNVGKSSLLNALLNQDRAIVTDIPGTTRDTLEETIIIGGVMFRLVDTAGVRQVSDPVEAEGVRRAEREIGEADVILFVLDASRPVSREDIGLSKRVLALTSNAPGKLVMLVNKADIEVGRFSLDGLRNSSETDSRVLRTSALVGTGLNELRDTLRNLVLEGNSLSGDSSVTITNARHYSSLLRAKGSLNKAEESFQSGMSGEFVAVDLRASIDNLGEIIGAVTTDDILNSIFSKFCIGK